MPLRRGYCIFAAVCLAVLAASGVRAHAEAALLLEEPYGFFGELNPTGHNAIYFENICAATPTQLRHCFPGELGSVIARYEGIDGYDWVAIPVIPYLYSVEKVSDVPEAVNRAWVDEMRNLYREIHFAPIDLDKSGGSYVHDGWKQLIGASYERRIYAFRFRTTDEQDDAVIARLNESSNVSHFHLLTRNCSDFARDVLNVYFPKVFKRSALPDAGITTPKQVTYNLVRYARKHPEIDMTVFELPQIPGYRRHSHSNKDIAESFMTTPYAIPLTLINPYLAGCIFVDYVFGGHHHVMPRHPEVLAPENVIALTGAPEPNKNLAGAASQVSSAASGESSLPQTASRAESDLNESPALR
jgi:hypothetical protein